MCYLFKVMKNVRLFWLLGIVLVIAGQSLCAQTKKEKREQKEKEVKELTQEEAVLDLFGQENIIITEE